MKTMSGQITEKLQELLTVVIPHHGGERMLLDCLSSIEKSSQYLPQVLLVDNASPDDSVQKAKALYPWLKILPSETNRGYAGGCNFGLAAVTTPYTLLLNNDVIVEPDCFDRLVERMEANLRLAAVQPKIRSYQNPELFDYAGAAGGLIDFDGIPFSYGRILDVMEVDQGQYDDVQQIFWASGTAVVFRMSALREVGTLEESFFAHQEEIDLCWRLWSAGWEVEAVPKAVIYHRGGATLNRSSNWKLYLNHRNSLAMWVRNAEYLTMLPVLRRVTLEIGAFGAYLSRGEIHRALHQVKAWRDFVSKLRITWSERKRLQALRKRSDDSFPGRYRGSVVWQFYFRRRRATAAFFRFDSTDRRGE
ncbi:MAG: glycosyltransferase family 2 protein [bacterium]|nr:glycosyltransferase family 2 protein [bacterium]